MRRPQDIVSKLWHLCNILRESGITYPEYVTELTYLLFLKMARETGSERGLQRDFRWSDLSKRNGNEQFAFYSQLLTKLGTSGSAAVRAIFADSQTALSKPKHLELLVNELDSINWYAAREEGALGDLYEGLLEKNSVESKSGAGQYFTPRAVVESIVTVVKPQHGEIIQDPACGTGGFLIGADRYIKENAKNRRRASNILPRKRHLIMGIELVRDTHRLALMNAMLHNVDSHIVCGDALDEAGANLPQADVILTNPPFGTKRGGGLPGRPFPVPTSNKQLAFLQHVYLGLKAGGRAAMVMPELFGSVASAVCSDLMEHCRLHTILRLPTGIFYAPGVKTNVLFFERGPLKSGNSSEMWVYDLRSGMPSFGKRTLLTREHFHAFERAYGDDSSGRSKRVDEGPNGRFRRFTRDEIRDRGNNLDLSWLMDKPADARCSSPNPDEVFTALLEQLAAAAKEVRALKSELNQS